MMGTLMAAVGAPANLWAAWRQVRSRRSAPGVDGVSVANFEAALAARLDDLRSALADGSYRPRPLRGVWIPKRRGGWRPAGVPTVRDRVAQRAVLNVLLPRFEPHLEKCSYAYRPGRSVLQALQQLQTWRRSGHDVLLEGDIQDCFGSIDRDLLLVVLHDYLDDAALLALIGRWLEAGIQWGDRVIVPPTSIPQGDLLSPLWCNVFLDAFDEALLAQNFKLVRYADDFVVVATRERRIQRARELAVTALADLGLRLHPDKTRITTFEQGFEYLGVRFVGDLVLPIQGQPGRTARGDEEMLWVPGYPQAPRARRDEPRPPPPQARGLAAVSSALARAGDEGEPSGTRLGDVLAYALKEKRRLDRRQIEKAAQKPWQTVYLTE